MAYENTQIAPDGKRRNIKSESSDIQDAPDVVEDVKDLAEDKNPSNDSGGSLDESQDKDASNQSDESINDESDDKNASNQSGGTEDDEFPKHVGRGVWQLRSGKKVKGKTEAVEAQAKEDESNDDSDAS